MRAHLGLRVLDSLLLIFAADQRMSTLYNNVAKWIELGIGDNFNAKSGSERFSLNS